MNEMKTAADKLRSIVGWLDWQDENFNNLYDSISQIEQVYDACLKHGFEFVDNLYRGEPDDEELALAIEINRILGKDVYCVE